jgi:hypothetical protein
MNTEDRRLVRLVFHVDNNDYALMAEEFEGGGGGAFINI